MLTLPELGLELKATAATHGFSLAFCAVETETPGGTKMPALVTVTVTDPGPTLVDDTATTPANTPVNVPVLANDTDPLGRTLQLTSVQSPTAQGGTAVINADGVSVDYTPPTNFVGSDTFTYDAAPV